MSAWINVALTKDFPLGTFQVVDLDDLSILVFNVDNHYFAIQNLCTHDGGDLAGGNLVGDEIVCPRHGARFCVKNGTATRPPAYEDVTTFPVRIENGMVQVKDDRFD